MEARPATLAVATPGKPLAASARLANICQEPEAREWPRPIRPTEPSLHRRRPGRKRSVEDGRVLGNSSPRRPAVGDHEQPSHQSTMPSALRRDLQTQPRLPVEGKYRRLEIRDDRLDLDDEDDAGRWVEREHVDRAPLATDVERDLDCNQPFERSKGGGDDVDERGMVAIQQAVERLAIPRHDQVQPGTERLGDRLDGRERQLVRMTSFDARNERSGDLRRRREISLPPAAASSKRSRLPNRIVSMARILTRAAHWTVSCDSPGYCSLIGRGPSPTSIRTRPSSTTTG